MPILKTKEFARFAKREDIADGALCEAVERADRGLVDVDLGGGLIKQRVARPGKGGMADTGLCLRSGPRR